MLNSEFAQEAISEIETNYAWDVERTSLEKTCIDAMIKDKSGQSPIDVCIAGMVASLDGHSSYIDPGKYQELKEQSLQQKQKGDTLTVASLYSAEIGYIKISEFLNNSRERISFKTADILKQHQSFIGLIIDLRNSHGGILQYVIDIAGLFLPEKTLIGSLESRRSSPRKQQYFTSPWRFNDGKVLNVLKTTPVIVLVNHKTSSGAEFLAAALKESGRAIIIGGSTARNGDVQTAIPLSDKRFLKLTTQFLVTPSGSSINEEGVKVDIESTENAKTNISQWLEDDPVVEQAYQKLKFSK